MTRHVLRTRHRVFTDQRGFSIRHSTIILYGALLWPLIIVAFFLRFSRTNTSITPHPPGCYWLRIPLASVHFSEPVVRVSLEDVNSVVVDPSRCCVSISQSSWPNSPRGIPSISVTTEAPVFWPSDKMGHISGGESRVHVACETTQSVPPENQSGSEKDIVVSVLPVSTAKSQCKVLVSRIAIR